MLVNVLIADYICGPYSYNSSIDLQVGTVVIVPLRSKNVTGVVVELNVDFNGKAKDIIQAYDYLIPNHYIKFLNFFAKYNCVSYGQILELMIYKNALTKGTRFSHDYSNLENKISLNESQSNTSKEMSNYISGFNVLLLEGVPGSGKSEVFLSLVWEVVSQGRQALILVPEIALTSSLINRIKRHFGYNPLYWNSNITDSQKKRSFSK